MKNLALAATLACAVATPVLAAGPRADTARTFVQRLYAHYPQKGGNSIFEPTDKDAAKVFEPGMVAAFQQDARLAKGEVGFVDNDPICGCQDDEGMMSKITSVVMKEADNADVLMNIIFPGNKPIAQTLHLVVVNGQWRIYDISTPDEKSYRADLLKANKDAAARRN